MGWTSAYYIRRGVESDFFVIAVGVWLFVIFPEYFVLSFSSNSFTGRGRGGMNVRLSCIGQERSGYACHCAKEGTFLFPFIVTNDLKKNYVHWFWHASTLNWDFV